MCGSGNLRLFWEFFKIGLFTIGGGMAMIPQIQQVAVDERGWLSEEEMIDCVALSQSMPGVIAINSATYIGRRVNGLRGALCTTAGVVMPSFIIIVLVVSFLGVIGDNRYLEGAFTGIKAAVCGLILLSAARLAKQILKGPFQWILAIAALIAIGVIGINAVWAVLGGALCGIIYQSFRADGRDEKEGEK